MRPRRHRRFQLRQHLGSDHHNNHDHHAAPSIQLRHRCRSILVCGEEGVVLQTGGQRLPNDYSDNNLHYNFNQDDKFIEHQGHENLHIDDPYDDARAHRL